jgi:putative ABC transport system substrate-binding protein
MSVERRRFLMQLGAAIASPLVAHAQTVGGSRRIGILIPFAENDADTIEHLKAFRAELAGRGWQEGQNLHIDYGWCNGNPALIAGRAKQLTALKPDILIGRSTPVARALAKETQTIPIIFVVVSDPVGDHLVASIARPGGNVTGFTNVEASLGGKWLGLLRDIAPAVKRVAIMFNPTTSPDGGSYYMHLIDDAAASTSMQITAMKVDDSAGIRAAIEAFAQAPDTGLIVLPDVLTNGHRSVIIEAAAEHKLPTIFAFRYIVADGGLASYGIDVTDLYKRAAIYADRILRGDKPAQLPVQAPIKFELAINLKTARSLGLTIPPALLATADETIE